MARETDEEEDEMAPYPLDCPRNDWDNDPTKPVGTQVADLLGHLQEAHGQGMPDTVRDVITACRKDLEKLPV